MIFYSLGYWFSPAEETVFIKTGLAYVATNPQGARIWLDQQKLSKKTPAVISELAPGAYHLRLELRGFQPWEAEIAVEPGKATVLDHILLLPKEIEEKVLIPQKFNEFWAILNKPVFLLKKGDSLSEYFIYDLAEEKRLRLNDEGAFSGQMGKVKEIDAHSENGNFLLKVNLNSGDNIFWARYKKGKVDLYDMTKYWLKSPERILWDAQDNRNLFIFDEGILNYFHWDEDRFKKDSIHNVVAFGIYDRKLLTIHRDGIVAVQDTDLKNRQVLSEENELIQSLFSVSDFYEIVPLHKKRMIFWGRQGALVANRLPYQYIPSGVAGLNYHRDSYQLLIWLKNRLGIIKFPMTDQEEIEIFEKRPEIQWLYESPGKIMKAVWIYEGSHILFQENNQLKLLEITNPRHVRELISVQEKTVFDFFEDSARVYYLNPKGEFASVAVYVKEFMNIISLQEIEAWKNGQR